MYPDRCTVSLLLYRIVLKSVSTDWGVRASLILFYTCVIQTMYFVYHIYSYKWPRADAFFTGGGGGGGGGGGDYYR